MLAVLFVAAALQVSPRDYLGDVVRELSKKWPENRMVEIVCHGHSVPAGYGKTPLVHTVDAYPNLLRDALAGRFPFAVINVTVTAIGGENSIQGEQRFARDVLSRHPDVVTIDYGLNDRGLDASSIRAAWQSMISLAKAAGVRVILLTPTMDLAARMDDPGDPLVLQAVAIRRLAREANVGLADSFAAFQSAIAGGSPRTSLMAQSNHPNRKGHELVAAELLKWFPSAR